MAFGTFIITRQKCFSRANQDVQFSCHSLKKKFPTAETKQKIFLKMYCFFTF